MATPLTADRIVDALRAEGVRVVEHDGWRTHNRNKAGAWGPVNGVMIHHTVTGRTVDAVALCYNGHSTLPGPLCHGVIERDGTVHLVGYGRANHAGGGDASVLQAVVAEQYGERPPAPRVHQGSTGAVDGNARFYGLECSNLGDGKDPWPAAQLDAIERVSAALCRAHGWSAKSIIGHLEWSDWKSDPRGFTMPQMRAYIAERLAHLPGWSSTDTTPVPGEDIMPTPAEYAQAVWEHPIPNRFRPSSDGKPRPIPARYYLEYGDDHYDSLTAAVAGLEQPVLTDVQVKALAEQMAASPGLADSIASKVAELLAERLAE